MTRIAIRTASRLGLQILIPLLLVAVLAVPAMAHEGKVNFGIDAVGITSAKRISLGRVVVKGTVSCSRTTSGVELYVGVQQIAGRTNTIRGDAFDVIRCVAGTKVPFSFTITPEAGKFVGGNALVEAVAYKEVYSETYDSWHYHYDFAVTEREMKLSR